jgi:hypothetical protein
MISEGLAHTSLVITMRGLTLSFREEFDTVKEAMTKNSVLDPFCDWVTETICSVKIQEDTIESTAWELKFLAESILEPLAGSIIMSDFEVKVKPINKYLYELIIMFWFDDLENCWIYETEIEFDNGVNFEF